MSCPRCRSGCGCSRTTGSTCSRSGTATSAPVTDRAAALGRIAIAGRRSAASRYPDQSAVLSAHPGLCLQPAQRVLLPPGSGRRADRDPLRSAQHLRPAALLSDPCAIAKRQWCARLATRRFYVSPFIAMRARYRFEIVPPARTAGDRDPAERCRRPFARCVFCRSPRRAERSEALVFAASAIL